MQKNIIGLLLCVLIGLTLIIPVTALSDKYKDVETSSNADVPIWEVGDRWTYHFIESRTHQYNYSFSGDITLKVVDDSGDSYILKGKTRPHGKFELGGIGLKPTILTTFSMELQMRKNTLGLERFVEKLKGIFLIKTGSITLPIPIQGELNYNIEFDPTWTLIPFPLYEGKYGNLSGTEILHSNVYVNLFWGLVPVYGPTNMSIPLTQIPYTCAEEQITVEAGTYDVYNVSAEWIEDYRFVSYYSEEVGNVAMGIVFIPYGGDTVWHSLVLELKDFRYTP
jgi:hypothetical protein